MSIKESSSEPHAKRVPAGVIRATAKIVAAVKHQRPDIELQQLREYVIELRAALNAFREAEPWALEVTADLVAAIIDDPSALDPTYVVETIEAVGNAITYLPAHVQASSTTDELTKVPYDVVGIFSAYYCGRGERPDSTTLALELNTISAALTRGE